jgi:hypothetical protein
MEQASTLENKAVPWWEPISQKVIRLHQCRRTYVDCYNFYHPNVCYEEPFAVVSSRKAMRMILDLKSFIFYTENVEPANISWHPSTLDGAPGTDANTEMVRRVIGVMLGRSGSPYPASVGKCP